MYRAIIATIKFATPLSAHQYYCQSPFISAISECLNWEQKIPRECSRNSEIPAIK